MATHHRVSQEVMDAAEAARQGLFRLGRPEPTNQDALDAAWEERGAALLRRYQGRQPLGPGPACGPVAHQLHLGALAASRLAALRQALAASGRARSISQIFLEWLNGGGR
jgi:hypothetical protein